MAAIPNLAELQRAFEENFELRAELGASVSLWVHGEEVLSLGAGWRDRQKTVPWDASSPVLVWSCTKGIAAACALRALAQAGLDLQSRVADIWPGFAQGGKAEMSFGQLLSHQAGLAALDKEVAVLDYPAVIEALENQTPLWNCGHGYHPRTFGYLLDEVVRRLAGQTLGEYWQREFAEPLALEAWIGLAEGIEVSSVFPARVGPPQGDAFAKALSDSTSLTARAFGSPRGLHSVASMNTAEARRASLPAFGGIATARALAKFYSSLIGAAEPVFGWMTLPLASGFDQVLQIETTFSAGFMKSRRLFGPSPLAFGHPGAGGSLAFADPENGIAFAYVMNQMEPGVLQGEKALALLRAVYPQP